MVVKQTVIDNEYFEIYNKEKDTGISRVKSMKIFMDKLNTLYPKIEISRLKKVDGADLKFKYDKAILKANFYHSKTYNSTYPSGWHLISSDQIETSNADFHIFNLKYYEEMYTFIFSKEELKEYVKDKKKDSGGNYHFNFELINGKMLETRDKKKTVKKYCNNIHIIQKMLKNKNKGYNFF